jgi:hypothetical protein
MRAVIALSLLLTASAAFGQDQKKGESLRPPAAQMQTDFSYFEYFGLYPRSFALEFIDQKTPDGQVLKFGRLTYVLEFERDLTSLHLEPLQRVMARQNKTLQHIFFDQENVGVTANRFFEFAVQGEVSGRCGEAFRVIVEYLDDPRASTANSKKLIVRGMRPEYRYHQVPGN